MDPKRRPRSYPNAFARFQLAATPPTVAAAAPVETWRAIAVTGEFATSSTGEHATYPEP